MKEQNRDSKGRFFPAGRRDAKQETWDRRAGEENKLAGIYVEICKRIGQPKLIRYLDIKHYPETGHWRVGYRTSIFFFGFLAGITFGVEKGHRAKKIASILALLYETGPIEKNILRLDRRYTKLVKQENRRRGRT